MIFELISWIYISLICLIWGNRILKVFFGINEVTTIDFPVVCFIGMSAIGIISYYLSLFIPLFPAVKLALQIPALLILLKPANREEIIYQWIKPFMNLPKLDAVFLFAACLMVMFLCIAPIIHPDTLNYHFFSIRIFDRYGSIPGLANLRVDLGFQSMWFAAMAFFDFSLFQTTPWFPLPGCVMGWFIVYLISKGSGMKYVFVVPGISKIWYLLLILFSILSWTQIRLTASSLSPDFIATISVLLAFYFYTGKQENIPGDKSDLMAALFAIIAVSIKLSVVLVLFIPLLITGREFIRGRFLPAFRVCLLAGILMAPIIIRNIISSGYPFYPSAFAALYPVDWKIDESLILRLQQYITAYARYPVIMVNAISEYNSPFSEWIPVWWRHLYAIDKAILLFIVTGIILDLIFLRNWMRSLTRRDLMAFLIALAGTLIWFLKAPDPRFGTGFLLPLIYFLYAPFFRIAGRVDDNYVRGFVVWIKSISAFCIFLYIGYRAIYFFHPSQLIYPEGIKNLSVIQPDCADRIKETILNDTVPPVRLPDSCRYFRFRGATIKQGFKPAR